MSQQVYELDMAMRTCGKCKRKLSKIYFSMTPGLFDEVNISADTHPTCNPCQIQSGQSGYRNLFPLIQLPRWSDRSECLPANAEKHLNMNERKNPRRALDRLLFPQTTADREAKAWSKICGNCPVKRECAEFGESSNSSGVWGNEYRYSHGEDRPEGAPHVQERRATAEHSARGYRLGCRCDICKAAKAVDNAKAKEMRA